MNEILKQRKNLLSQLLIERGLENVLILGAGRDKINRWLLGKEAAAEGPPGLGETPTLPPFNRSNIYIFTVSGDVISLSSAVPHPTDAAQYPVLEPENFPDIFGKNKIGIINPECLKKILRDKILSFNPSITFVDISDDFIPIRSAKSAAEVAKMAEAAAVYDRAFSAMQLVLRDGKTEHDAAADFRWRLAQLGASDQDLQTLNLVRLTSSPDGGLSVPEPLMYPGRRLSIGDRINISCTGYLPGGHSAALGRCYIMGKASDEAKKYWSLAVSAQDYAASLAVPGATIDEITGKVNNMLAANGLPEDKSAWLYGIGAGRFEAPRNVDKTAFLPLKSGMTLVIAPHICPDGKDPYQCMDVYTVAENGARRLSRTSRKLVELF